MLSTFRTLFAGATVRSEDRLRDAYAVELIDQKIRETEGQLQAAKATLASLIQRRRSEQRLLEMLQTRIASLTERARKAIENGRNDMATEAASAIADMENEGAVRQTTLDRLDVQVTRLRNSVEQGHRLVIDLKQGAMQAKAIRREQKVQAGLHTTLHGVSAADEAQSLIDRVIGKYDPLEQAQILSDLDAGLDHSGLEDRMADAGFGDPTKVTARDVLDRLTK